MFENLEEAEKRYETVGEELMKPEVVTDAAKYRDLMKEHKNLTPIIEKYREYKRTAENLSQAKELLDEGGLDADMKEIRAMSKDIGDRTQDIFMKLLALE